jgi:hypothetical protein
MNSTALRAGLAAAIASNKADIQFRPGGLEAVVELLGDDCRNYLSETNPDTVTTEMRNLLANGDDPLALKLRPFFVIEPH